MIQESFSAQFIVYFNSFFFLKKIKKNIFHLSSSCPYGKPENSLEVSFSCSVSLGLTFELLASINLLNLSARLKQHENVLTKMCTSCSVEKAVANFQ